MSENMGQSLSGIFSPITGSWYESLETPEKFQKQTLLKLLNAYEKTTYGERHHAREVSEIADFRSRFPILKYRDLLPFLDEPDAGGRFEGDEFREVACEADVAGYAEGDVQGCGWGG